MYYGFRDMSIVAVVFSEDNPSFGVNMEICSESGKYNITYPPPPDMLEIFILWRKIEL